MDRPVVGYQASPPGHQGFLTLHQSRIERRCGFHCSLNTVTDRAKDFVCWFHRNIFGQIRQATEDAGSARWLRPLFFSRDSLFILVCGACCEIPDWPLDLPEIYRCMLESCGDENGTACGKHMLLSADP